MGYNITSESQLIDINAIKSGCEKFKTALDAFEKCGKKVTQASETCNKKALSVDGSSMEYSIADVATAITNLKSEYSGYADSIYSEAISIYNSQVAELNAYIEAQKAAQQQNNN
ncbi:MAG: hypothetical protein PUG33_03670 [Mollicutes bacterium]|nr:hypothetical protein [Mollicutes bacterium]MDY5874543.1 hypothetical protein [Bacilli bacterium]